MYKHLLVPIDGTPLSNATVDQALGLAVTLKSCVTFLHARQDIAATGEGALLHAAAPAVFAEAAAGNARAMVARAEAAARAVDVPCGSLIVSSDRPHEAIVDAAREVGCDLIVMASHGRRGLQGALLGSVTHKVLRHAKVPVLVAVVESNVSLSDEQRAVAAIRDEHRSLAAVLHALLQVLGEAATSGRVPDMALLRAMLFYIEQFPERLHHPKEDVYLFQRLRQRTRECDGLIEGLERQHLEGAQLFVALRELLQVIQDGAPGSLDMFTQAVRDFAQSQWNHMSAEERLLLPAASRFLTVEDWAAIAAAFADNGDPRFGSDAHESFTQLASRLHNLAAATITSPGNP